MKPTFPMLTLLTALLIAFSVMWANANADRPNILFVISDDQSYPHTSAYGCTWVETPGFDRIAREGLLFNNAYTTNAKCAPSRSSIVTGRYSWSLEAAGNHVSFFPDKFITFFEALESKAGYHVGYTGKGVAPVVVMEGRLLTGKACNAITLTPPGEEISNVDYSANFRRFLEEKAEGQPFCFWFGALEPHRRYE